MYSSSVLVIEVKSPGRGFVRRNINSKNDKISVPPKYDYNWNMSRESPGSSTKDLQARELLDAAFDAVETALPNGWLDRSESEFAQSLDRMGARNIDATLTIKVPNGEFVRYVIALLPNRSLKRRDLASPIAKIESFAMATGMQPMLVAWYLSPPVRDQLEAQGFSYADATGNLWLTAEQPALAVRNRGADRDPRRGPGRIRGSLKGEPAARVVRALVDARPPITVPQLIELSEASVSAAYRIVEFLQEEGLIERDTRQPIKRIEWASILRRWILDYAQEQPSFARGYLQPHGVMAAIDELRGVDADAYVLTGSFAANRYLGGDSTRLLTIYSDAPNALAARIGAEPSEQGANVMIYSRGLSWAKINSKALDSLRYAAPSQVAADMAIGPGREPNESEGLIDWMQANEPDWR